MTSLTTKTRQYVTFQLGEELFGIEVHRAREILSLIPITKVPQTPKYMMGVINLRGQVLPVVDMRLKLGLVAQENTQDTCIIVMEVQGEDEKIVVGAMTDAVREVIEIKDDQVEPPPRMGSGLNTEFINGMGKVDGNFMIILDIDKIFSSDELTLVQDAGEFEAGEASSEEVFEEACIH